MNSIGSAVRVLLPALLLSGAIAPLCTAEAQTPPDTIRRPPVRDSLQDSIRTARVADTIKAPIAHFESPPDYETGSRLSFNRQELLSSGAMYVTDLLERVAGVVGFRSGWLAGIHTAAYRGDFRRIRIFVDGIEFDAIGPRNDGVVDHVELPLWTLDAIEVEQTPTEVRVWCRSATVRRTTPYSRVDIFTGDLNTNGFRGLFARRFQNGFALQLAGQHVSTQRGRTAFGENTGGASQGNGDQQAYNARLGWARGRLSIDGYATAVTNRREKFLDETSEAELPAYTGSRRDGYLRVAYGDTERGFWSQVMLSTLRAQLEGIRTPVEGQPVDTSSADTVRHRGQTLLAAGWRAKNLSVSLVDRMRGIDGRNVHSPVARATYAAGFVSAGVYAEQSGLDSMMRADLFARARPLPWLSLLVVQSMRSPHDSSVQRSESATRAEASLGYRGRWVSGGIIRHDLALASSPILLGAAPSDGLVVPQSIGITAGFRGAIYKDLFFESNFVRWDNAAFGRPQMHVRSELRLASRWLSRFPRGQFAIDARLTHELRDPVSFYYGVDGEGAAIRAATERTQLLHGTLEIRIQQASIFYQYRNLTGNAYSQIPGITMPPAIQMYGVRWEFWN